MKYSTKESQFNIVNNTLHRKPTREMIGPMSNIRELYRQFALYIDENIPPSRERSLALTALEEARMWAISAIVYNSPWPDDIM